MTQILIIVDDKPLQASLNKNLIKHLGCEVVLQDSSRNAISMMSLIPDIDVIICKDVIKKDAVAQKMSEFIVEHNKEIGKEILLFILGENKTAYTKVTAVDPKSSWEQIVTTLAGLLDIKVEIAAPAAAPAAPAAPVVVLPEYYPLNIKYYYFLAGLDIKFESYAKIVSKEGKDTKINYELRFQVGEKFDRATIEKYIAKGTTEFYIPKAQIAAAESLARAQLMAKVRTPPAAEKDRDQLNSDSFDLALDLVKNQEVDEYTLEIINLNLKAMVLSTTDSRALDIYLKKRKTLKQSYGYSHCLLTCLIIQNIIKNFKWSTQEMKDSIVYLLYFHDISLLNDRLIKNHHNYFQKISDFSADETKLVLSHALLASSIVEKFKEVSPDVVNLVREHHGIKSGKNFQETLSIIISPLTMVLIVVEDFVTRYLDLICEPAKEKDHLTAIFNDMSKKYNKLTYAEALKFTQRLIEEGGEKLAAEEAALAQAAMAAKAALAAQMASVTASEVASKSEAAKAVAANAAAIATRAAEKAAAEKAAADLDLTNAVAASAKAAAEQAAADQAVATALVAVQKAAAAKLSADQAAAVARNTAEKSQAMVNSLTIAADRAKAIVMKTIAEKAAAEQAAWKAADKATADQQEARTAAERAAALALVRKT